MHSTNHIQTRRRRRRRCQRSTQIKYFYLFLFLFLQSVLRRYVTISSILFGFFHDILLLPVTAWWFRRSPLELAIQRSSVRNSRYRQKLKLQTPATTATQCCERERQELRVVVRDEFTTTANLPTRAERHMAAHLYLNARPTRGRKKRRTCSCLCCVTLDCVCPIMEEWGNHVPKLSEIK